MDIIVFKINRQNSVGYTDVLLRLFGVNFCTGSFTKTAFWFRFFGYGLAFKDLRNHRLLFSERNGYKKSLKIYNWHISALYKF